MPGFKNAWIKEYLDLRTTWVLSVSISNLYLESEPVQSSKFSVPKANIFSLSKEFSDSEKTIRSKMVAANIEGVEKVGEQAWQKDGYLGKINPNYSTHKNDFPEN